MRGPQFAAFAVSRTGNRGAVSMLESAIDHLTAEPHAGRVSVFSVYPRNDRAATPRAGVDLHDGTPGNLVGRLIPLSLLYRLARPLRRIPRSLWGRDMRALLDADVVLLIGGTTFSDAQQFKVIYNVACALPALLLGKPTMLYSQTLGPFATPFNRLCASWCLHKMAVVVPRGEGSEAHVRALGIEGARALADAAFTLQVPEDTTREIREKYRPLLQGKKVVGISINSIVERKCRARKIDHNGIWAAFIEALRNRGYFVLLVPHSIRPHSRSRHNNDLVTLADIRSKLSSQAELHVVEEPYDCKQLREVVGLADYYVASRFHSMISALCTGTPVTVVGWGHQKYLEVMRQFELDQYCQDAADLSLPGLLAAFDRIVEDSESIKERIQRNFPAVQESSQRNHVLALELAERSRRAERQDAECRGAEGEPWGAPARGSTTG